MSLIKIDLENGKYTVLHDEEHGGVTVLRYSEPWRNETGDGFILAMIHHIQKLEHENKKYQEYIDENSVEAMQKKMECFYEDLAKHWYGEEAE